MKCNNSLVAGLNVNGERVRNNGAVQDDERK